MKKQILFFDIDGTLLEFGCTKISARLVSALQSMQQQGYLIGICSGRQAHSAYQLFQQELTFDFIIGSNGKEVMIGDQLVYQNPLAFDLLQKLITFDREHHVGLLFCSSFGMATFQPATHICIDYLQKLHIPIPPCDPTFHLTHPILQVMIYCDEPTQKRCEELVPELSFIRHNNSGIDIFLKGKAKEQGIELVLQYYGLHVNTALAFGDGLNDVGMFQCIDGVCVGKSHPALVEVAIEQIGNIDEDAIYYYLQKNHYIREGDFQ